MWFVEEEEFAAGVMTLSWHPTEELVFAVESCDESVRVYNIRVMSSGGRGRGVAHPVLGRVGCGGGVWRIKWNKTKKERLLVGAMHGGCCI